MDWPHRFLVFAEGRVSDRLSSRCVCGDHGPEGSGSVPHRATSGGDRGHCGLAIVTPFRGVLDSRRSPLEVQERDRRGE